MSHSVRAGFSRIEITPPLERIEAYGIGYWYRRSVRFTGVRDPLFARALVIDADALRYVLISVDSILDSYGFVRDASSRIASVLGIDADNVFITCTHTHSSPLIDRNDTRLGVEYGPFVTERIVQSAIEANRNCVDAAVSLSAGSVHDVLYNRRPLLRNGRIPELHRPVDKDSLADPGPVNDTMTIVKFRASDGKLLGGLCHFGIHGVAVQCSERISSDCMGRAIQAAEHDAGNQVVFMHLNGPCGDIDPILMGDDAALDTMTKRLHAGICRILGASEHPLEATAEARALRGTFRAARRSARPSDALERDRQKRLDTAARETAGAQHHSGSGYEAFLLAEESKVSALPGAFDIPYQILRWGKLLLVGVGGEVFTRSGLTLQAMYPDASILPVGLTGGAAGYLPTEEMYQQGGYEVACASWCPIAPGETEKLFTRIGSDLGRIVESDLL